MTKKRATQSEPIYIDTTTETTTQQTVKELLTQLKQAIQKTRWQYKNHIATLQLRDQAASVVFIVAGLRNSEVCQGPQQTSGWKYYNSFTAQGEKEQRVERRIYKPNSYPLKRKQIRIYTERIVILNAQTVKHGKLRPEIVFPKKGGLAPFAEILESYVNKIDALGAEPESYLFPPAYPNTKEYLNAEDRTEKNPFNFTRAMSTNRIWRIIKDTTNLFPHWYRAVCETLYGRVILKNAHMLKDRMGLTTLEATVPYVQSNYKEHEKNAENL